MGNDAHNSDSPTATVPGIFNMERVFLATLEGAEVLHTKSYSFIKPLPVGNDNSNILRKKRLLFAEHGEQRC